MKNLYILFLTLSLSFFCNLSFAQCDGVTLASLSNPGPFSVATMTEADGVRNGPNYAGSTIYYPTNATPPFMSIAIVPGYTALPSSVAEWGPFYASHGIVTIIIGTNSLFESPEARANGLLDALETVRQENTRAASPLAGELDLSKMAVSGWSMGGGGAQRAAVLDNTVSGVVAMCPYLPNASAQLNHQSPVLIFSGQVDTVAPHSQHADLHYAATPSTTDKLLFEVANGNHSVANTPNGGGGIVGKIALSWLKLYVEGNDCYCSILKDELLVNPSTASNVQQSFECTSLSTKKQEIKAGIYPNPTSNIVNIEIQDSVHYQLFSPLGQIVLEGNLTGINKQINLSHLAADIYFLNIDGQVIKVVKYN